MDSSDLFVGLFSCLLLGLRSWMERLMDFVMVQYLLVLGLDASYEEYGYSREPETQERDSEKDSVERSC